MNNTTTTQPTQLTPSNTIITTSVTKKTQRKNKTNLVLVWPANTTYFTIKDLIRLNPDFKEITLRVRLKKAIDEEKSVGVIGTTNPGKGRPSLVLAMRPVLQSVLDSAKADSIQLDDQTKLVNVMSVATSTNVTSVSTSNVSSGKTVVVS